MVSFYNVSHEKSASAKYRDDFWIKYGLWQISCIVKEFENLLSVKDSIDLCLICRYV